MTGIYLRLKNFGGSVELVIIFNEVISWLILETPSVYFAAIVTIPHTYPSGHLMYGNDVPTELPIDWRCLFDSIFHKFSLLFSVAA